MPRTDCAYQQPGERCPRCCQDTRCYLCKCDDAQCVRMQRDVHIGVGGLGHIVPVQSAAVGGCPAHGYVHRGPASRSADLTHVSTLNRCATDIELRLAVIRCVRASCSTCCTSDWTCTRITSGVSAQPLAMMAGHNTLGRWLRQHSVNCRLCSGRPGLNWSTQDARSTRAHGDNSRLQQ